jgi:hypothetical protein
MQHERLHEKASRLNYMKRDATTHKVSDTVGPKGTYPALSIFVIEIEIEVDK